MNVFANVHTYVCVYYFHTTYLPQALIQTAKGVVYSLEDLDHVMDMVGHSCMFNELKCPAFTAIMLLGLVSLKRFIFVTLSSGILEER